MYCPMDFDYENCSVYEHNCDCGTCIHTENLTVEQLRRFLSTTQQSLKFETKLYDGLFHDIEVMNAMIDKQIKKSKETLNIK